MYLVPITLPILTILFISFTFNNYNKNVAISFIFSSLIVSLFFCLIMVYEVIYLNSTCFINLIHWFELGNLTVSWSFYFDKLSVIMLFLVICISLVVHFSALDYLSSDPHLSRFLILYIYLQFLWKF